MLLKAIVPWCCLVDTIRYVAGTERPKSYACGSSIMTKVARNKSIRKKRINKTNVTLLLHVFRATVEEASQSSFRVRAHLTAIRGRCLTRNDGSIHRSSLLVNDVRDPMNCLTFAARNCPRNAIDKKRSWTICSTTSVSPISGSNTRSSLILETWTAQHPVVLTRCTNIHFLLQRMKVERSKSRTAKESRKDAALTSF
jgi:hypothetical protein